MPYIHYNEKQVYYEILGEGKPLLILNGIMMSTASWSLFKEEFSRNNQIILLVFLDQGRSDKLEDMIYTQEIQVEVIKALLDSVALAKVSMMGISYGGEVALQFAIKYEEYVERLILANTAGRTSPWLKEIGTGWNLSKGNSYDYYATAIPVIYSPEFYNKNIDWMENRKSQLTKGAFQNKEFMDAMERLTNSANEYNVVNQLHKISVATLIISSENDYLTPMSEQRLLNQLIANSELVILPNTGHASMYERPVLFASLVLGFVNLHSMNYKI